jgi:inositol oxygenase
VYSTELGIYERGCGFDNVHLSWGHDEYIYQVAKDYLPAEGLAMLRYHSFYPWHREGAYRQFENDHDRAMLPWVLKFNEFDLYSKSDSKPDVEALKPFYEDLIAEYFPEKIRW